MRACAAAENRQRATLLQVFNVMLVILLLFTLCSADSDLQLQVHQLQLHSTVQGEDTWLYASESWYLAPVFLPFDFCFRKCPGCM